MIMKRLGMMMVAGLLAAGASACFDDPVMDLRGGPDRLQFSLSYVVLNVGDTQRVDVKVYDAQGGSLPFSEPTYTTANASVATGASFPDAKIDSLPNSDYWKAVVVGTGAGFTKVAVTAAGITDSISVLVFPVAFTGTWAPATPAEGAEVTITAPAGLTFQTNSAVTVGGLGVFQTGQTATELKFIATPAGADQDLGLTNLQLLGQFNIASLVASSPISITNADEPGNDNPATAQALTAPANVGDSVIVYGSISDSDIDDFWVFTTGAAGDYRVTIFWPNNSVDIDGFVLNGTGGGFCVLDGCAMATGADPEARTVTLAAATAYQVLVELYDPHGIAMPHPYRLVLKRIS
jgi:hypothetical protein